MARSEDKLYLTVGNTSDIELFFLDENDEIEQFSGATAATFVIKESVSGSTILSRDTGSGNLTIDVVEGKLVATLSQVEADALTPGLYIASTNVQFPSGWVPGERFYVEISAPIAGTV